MTCKFRNCQNKFEDKTHRNGECKKFCSKSCKNKENIYLKRDVIRKGYKLLFQLTDEDKKILSLLRPIND